MATEQPAERTLEERVQDLETELQRRACTLEQQVLRLHRDRRRLTWALGGTAALTALIFVTGGLWLPLHFRGTVRAPRFVLTGAGGERAVLEATSDGSARLLLLDGKGSPRMRLVARDGGSAGLTLSDGRGEARLVLGLLPDESGSLVLADRGGAARAVLGVSATGVANLVFADGVGTTRAAFGVDALGVPSLEVPEQNPEPAQEVQAADAVAADSAAPVPPATAARPSRQPRRTQ